MANFRVVYHTGGPISPKTQASRSFKYKRNAMAFAETCHGMVFPHEYHGLERLVTYYIPREGYTAIQWSGNAAKGIIQD